MYDYTFVVGQPGHWVFVVGQQHAASDAVVVAVAVAVAVVADGDADTLDDFDGCFFSLI